MSNEDSMQEEQTNKSALRIWDKGMNRGERPSNYHIKLCHSKGKKTKIK